MLSIRTKKQLIPINSSFPMSVSTNTNKAWGNGAVSSDGSIIYACTNNDYIYNSVDGGLTFQPITSLGIAVWGSIATSANGKYVLVSKLTTATLFLSTDGGLTWSTKETSKSWTSVSMSSNGQKMVAINIGNADNIYISTDFGNTWSTTASPSLFWSVVRISGDGLLIMASADSASVIWASSDNGVNWTNIPTPFVSGRFLNLALSNTGQYLIIFRIDGSASYIYTSKNFGTDISTTPVRISDPGQTIITLSTSSTGQYMIYTISSNTIGVSSDFGSSFTVNPAGTGTQSWRFTGMSSDGTIQYLSVSNQNIYKSVNSGTSFTTLPTSTIVNTPLINYITTNDIKKEISSKKIN